MKVVRWEFYDVARSDTFRLIPISDVHLGARGCDEMRLKRTVQDIATSPNTYWVDLGDKAEFINMKDPRFSITSLAEWIEVADLVDLARVQQNRYIEIMAPIADRLLAMVKGNHAFTIHRYTERDIHSHIVSKMKGLAGHPESRMLDLDVTGWLQLVFYRSALGERRASASLINISMHHGFVSSRLAGAKALNMQRWLWQHDCDLALMGHAHVVNVQRETCEKVDKGGNVLIQNRTGVFCGTYLMRSEGPADYSERSGYPASPSSGVEIILRPRARYYDDRIKVIT